jgi:hypothetical protein
MGGCWGPLLFGCPPAEALRRARLGQGGDRLPGMDENQTERIELLLQLIADELLAARMERVSEMSISRGREDHVGPNIPAAVGDINKLRAKIRTLQKS